MSMRRQQVLKCHFKDCFMTGYDRFMTGYDRFVIKTVIEKAQCLCGFAGFYDSYDSFFQVLKIFKKNQNNNTTSKKLSFLS